MQMENVKTGLDFIGEVPRGTRLCHFYQTKEDLIDILLPYFRAGLENNEFCLWVVSDPLEVEDAKALLKKTVADLDERIEKGQMEIADVSRWYVKSGEFAPSDAFEGWIAKEEQVKERGFNGIRFAANHFWLSKQNWREFVHAGAAANSLSAKLRSVSVCSYPLDKHTISEVIGLVSNYGLSIIKLQEAWFGVRAGTNLLPDGSIHWSGIVIDITERKRLEVKLLESETKYRTLVESAPVGIWILQDRGEGPRVVFANPAVTEMFGYNPGEIPGLSFEHIFPQQSAAIATRNFEMRITDKPVPSKYEIIAKRKNGEQFFIEITPTKIVFQGKPAIQAMVTDISERKKAEQLLGTITDNAPIGVYIIQDGVFKYVNPRFMKDTGYSESELSGMNPIDMLHPEDRDGGRKIEVVMLKGEDFSTTREFRILTKAGDIKWILQRVTPIQYRGKQAILGNSMDITEYKRVEEEALRRQRDITVMREMDRMKSILLSTVSHELRSPLTIIKGYASILQKHNDKLNDSEKRDYYAAMSTACNRLTDLIENLLDTSRLEAGLLKIQKKPDDVSEVVKLAVAEARLRAPGHDIGANIEEGLPAVNIDARRIRQVVDNLIDNAVKYSSEGTSVMVEAHQRETELLISVADQGMGIPADELGRIFNRFYRIEQRLSSDPGGMGLGLSLCKALVEAHGGRIWAESAVGRGSTFYFTIPL